VKHLHAAEKAQKNSWSQPWESNPYLAAMRSGEAWAAASRKIEAVIQVSDAAAWKAIMVEVRPHETGVLVCPPRSGPQRSDDTRSGGCGAKRRLERVLDV
jgi:hypothetical protein